MLLGLFRQHRIILARRHFRDCLLSIFEDKAKVRSGMQLGCSLVFTSIFYFFLVENDSNELSTRITKFASISLDKFDKFRWNVRCRKKRCINRRGTIEMRWRSGRFRRVHRLLSSRFFIIGLWLPLKLRIFFSVRERFNFMVFGKWPPISFDDVIHGFEFTTDRVRPRKG